NGQPIVGVSVEGTTSDDELSAIWERDGDAEDFPGMWRRLNSLTGIDDAQVGIVEEGAIIYNGRLYNKRKDEADVSVSAEATFNLALGNSFTLTAPNSDRALRFINGKSGYTGLIMVNVLTSGTTSRSLSAGTNAVMQSGAF